MTPNIQNHATPIMFCSYPCIAFATAASPVTACVPGTKHSAVTIATARPPVFHDDLPAVDPSSASARRGDLVPDEALVVFGSSTVTGLPLLLFPLELSASFC